MFFQIGITSFGGHMSLIAIVEKKLIGEKGLLTQEDLLDAIAVASVLPGPLAVNIIAFLGYKIRGFVGAFVSISAVLLPSFLLMIALAIGFKQVGNQPWVHGFISGAITVVIAVIISVGINISKKQISSNWQSVLLMASFLALVLLSAKISIILFLLVGAVTGLFFHRKVKHLEQSINLGDWHIWIDVCIIILVMTVLFIVSEPINRQLLLQFSKVSLTLFGGGYVMIPLLYDLVVERLGWISSEEFNAAITLGQITPGPILISATFIGYKVSGIYGAVLATIGIFLPSASLMVIVSYFFSQFKEHYLVRSILAGMYPVVVAMIFSSAIIVFRNIDTGWVAIPLVTISFYFIHFRKISYLPFILGFGFIGILLEYL
ncbi:MAG: chromate transporter [Cyclobacteriaceae bacterium]|jgi:chromate transporter